MLDVHALAVGLAYATHTSLLAPSSSIRMHIGPEPDVSSAAAAVKQLLEADASQLNVLAHLGAGAHGEVLLGERMDGGGRVAIKLGLRHGAIDREHAVLSAMAGIAGFPKVLHHSPAGIHGGGTLVMELLGPSIEDLWGRTLMHSHISAPSVLRVGRGAVRRLRQLHLAGFVHNDVKPANLLLGAPTASARWAGAIHLIDFGLSSRCGAARDGTLSLTPPPRDEPIGTPSFASLAAHQRLRAMRPVDDIEVRKTNRAPLEPMPHTLPCRRPATECHSSPSSDSISLRSRYNLTRARLISLDLAAASQALVYVLGFLSVGHLPWTGEHYSDAARMKRQMLTDGSRLLTECCPLADVLADSGHCADVAHALQVRLA